MNYDDAAGAVAQDQQQPATPQAANDPYDAAASQVLQNTAGNIRTNVALSAGQNPDQEAEYQRLAKMTGMPIETVRNEYPAVKQQAAAQAIDADGIARTAPHLANRLADPNTAPLMRDDTGPLSGLEQTVAQHPAVTIGDRISQFRQSLIPLVHNTITNILGAVPFVGEDLQQSEAARQGYSNLINAMSLGIVPQSEGTPSTTGGQVAAGLGQLGGFVTGPVKIAEAGLERLGVNRLLAPTVSDSFVKATAKSAVQGAATLGTASAIGATGNAASTHDLPTALGVLGTSAKQGAEMGATFGAVSRLFPDATVPQFVARTMANTALLDMQQGKTPFQDLADWHNLTDAQKVDTVFNYGLNTFFSLGGAGRTQGGWFRDAAKADAAEQGAQTLGAISQNAAASAYRTRDPDGFKQFMQDMTEDSNLPNVYIDGHTFAQELDKAGVNADQLRTLMPEVAGQMNEALQTGGMVRIPTADYAAHIAGGPMDGALLQHLKTDPEGMSYAEAQDYKAQQADTLAQEAQRIAQTKQDRNAWEESQQKVHDTILQQLKDTGHYPDDVAKINAKIGSSFIATLADRLGITPEEAFKEHGAAVTGFTQGSGDIFDQAKATGYEGADTGEAYEWVRAAAKGLDMSPEARAKRMQEQGYEPGYYHGTMAGNDIHAFDLGKTGARTGSNEGAVFLTDNPDQAAAYGYDERYNYTDQGIEQEVSHGQVMPLALRKGKVLDASSEVDGKYDRAKFEEIIQRAREEGYDTVDFGKVHDTPEGTPYSEAKGNVLAVLKPENIRSTQAAFDPEYKGENGLLNQPAYHGTPYKFDKFSLEHLGKGEGAQAFGWGLYFAGDKQVAKWYKEALETTETRVDGAKVSPGDPHFEAAIKIATHGYDQALANAKDEASAPFLTEAGRANAAKLAQEIEKLKDAKVESVKSGQLYKVDIPEDDTMLHWDKPLSEQPKAVQNAIASLAMDYPILGFMKKEDASGGAIYKALAGSFGESQDGGPQEKASKLLNKTGVEGIKYLDGSSRSAGEGSYNYVIFDDNAVKILDRYYQNNPAQEARGYYSPSNRTIGLLKNADLSTYIHETGHYILDTYARLAASENAPPVIKQDMDTLLKWFGVKDLETWNKMTLAEQRDNHEKMARGFEAYLMEGKAPTQELQSVFSRVRAWMVNIYKTLRGLDVELTPEVRQVFDRMLATDEAIQQTQAQRGYALPEAKPDYITDAEWQTLQQAHDDATNAAVDEMQAKSLQTMKYASGAKSRALRDLQRQANAQRKAVREEVTKEVDAMPVYRAEAFIKRGVLDLEDTNQKGRRALESAAGRNTKLDLGELKEMYGEGPAAQWRYLTGLTAKDGLAPDIVAEITGFKDGDELVRALLAREPRASVIDGLTDRYMLERHGELATPDALERAAEEAIHNELRSRFMAVGLKVLTKSPISARVLEKNSKEAADAAIAAKKVRDVNPRQYTAAETKANKAMLNTVAKDPAGAVKAQREALLNNQLAKSAMEAQTDIQKGLDYFKKFKKDSVREKIDVSFRDQIDALLANHDLRTSYTPEEASQQRRMSLEKFVENLSAMKYNVDVSEYLLTDTKTHYKDMTVEQFRGLVDAVRSLDNLGREIQKITDGDQKRMLDEVAQEAADAAAKLPQRKAETNRGLSLMGEKWLETKHFGRSFMASLLKVEQMMDWMDNRDPLGVFNRMVFRKIADAEGARNDLDLRITKNIEAYVKAMPKDIIKDSRKVLEMPGVIDSLTGETQRVTWGQKMSLAAIRGDAGHFAKLLKGEGWDAGAVIDFLDKNVTKEEWDFIKGMADQFQEIHPLKQQMMRDLGSTAPGEVARVPFPTPHGDMPGWYWPITYDPARSQAVKERGAAHGASLFEDNIYTRADTSTGRENTRNENYAKPMLLSIDTFPRVLKDEIRDITTRKAIIEVDRFLSHPDVRKAISSALSPEHYDQLNGWLLSLANDAAVKPTELRMWDRLAHELRVRTTMVGLGFRISTMVMHGLTAAGESVAEAGFKPMFKGVFNAKTLANLTKAIGPEWLEKGLSNFIRSDQWDANANFIFDRSAEMRHRSNEFERDVREKLRDIQIELMNPATGAIERAKLAVQSRAYQGIAILDMASAMPTWMGAYLKAIEKPERGGLGYSEQDAIYFADKTVRNAHGGGGIKDMAAVQRGSEFMKLFTMFYTFWNHNINRLADTARRYRQMPENIRRRSATGNWQGFGGDVGTLMLRTFMYTLGVQAIHHMMHPPKPGDQPDTWLEFFAKSFGLSAVSGIPIARDIAGHYANGRDYEASPFTSIISNTDRLLKDADSEAEYNQFVKHALIEAGYIFALPTGQAATTVQFLSDVWDGRQHPQDMAEWWNGIVHGRTH